MPKKFAILLALLLATLIQNSPLAETSFLQIKLPLVKLLDAPTQNAQAKYTAFQGIYFQILEEKAPYYKVALITGENAWIHSENTTPYKHPVAPPVFRIGLVNNIVKIASQNIAQAPQKPTQSALEKLALDTEKASPPDLPKKAPITAPPKPKFTTYYQEDPEYYYPELPSNFNLDINGFYETKISMRDYNPTDVNDKRWDSIRNDPAYKKLPHDVLLGDPKLDIRYKISIDGQINEKLSVHYDIEEEPDFPGKYDIKIKYDKSQLTFHHFDTKFDNGEFINVSKALDGVMGSTYTDNWEAQFAIGRQRSEPQKQETFGNGSKTLKLNNRSILRGSVRLFLNNSQLANGRDYTVNHHDGVVSFITITPQKSDFIKVIYEFTNPIEDFIPALSRKNFLGTEFKWRQESKDTIIRLTQSKSERLWPISNLPETSAQIGKEFPLKHKPVKLGSETVYMNGKKLIRNKDYAVKNQRGKIVLLNNTPLFESDTITISYDYYLAEDIEETLIGNDTTGPYTLQKDHVLEESVQIFVDNHEVQEGIDYKLDAEKGQINFNYDVAYPKLIHVNYRAVKTKTIKNDIKDSPLSVGVTYLSESVKADEETIVTAVSDSNLLFGENNTVTVNQNPILASENLTVSVGGSAVSFNILNAYTGRIQVTGVNTQAGVSTAQITYSYNKSFQSQTQFKPETDNSDNVYTAEEMLMSDLPVKYKGISTIQVYGTIGNRIQGPNESTELTEGRDFKVNYNENASNPGESISIEFYSQKDPARSDATLQDYPKSHNTIRIIYNFTPSTTPDEGQLSQSMLGVTVESKINDNWKVGGEIVGAAHNFSKPRVATATVIQADGRSIDKSYSIGKINLVEDSESVAIINDKGRIDQTKDEDYFINYRLGTIRFKKEVLPKGNEIHVAYEFFDTGNTEVGESQGFKLATKFASKYQTDTLKVNADFKSIDKDFTPIGRIEDTKGTTSLGGDVTWTPEKGKSVGTSYRNKKIAKNFSNIDEDIFLNQQEIKANAQFPLFDTFKNTVSARLFEEVQDKKPEEDTHDIDNKTVEINGTTTFGPDHFINTVTYKISQSESDYLDRLALSETNINNIEWVSTYKKNQIRYLGNLAFSPHFSQNTTKTESTTSQVDNIRRKYGTDLKIAPSRALYTRFNYSIEQIDIESQSSGNATTKTVQDLKNLLGELTYKPKRWFSTFYSYKLSEKEGTSVGQSGENINTNTFKISRFEPKGMLVDMGVAKDNMVNRFLKSSYFTLNSIITNKNERNNAKSSDKNSYHVTYNTFEPIPGFKFKQIYYRKTDSDSLDIRNSTSVSKNIFSLDQENYGTQMTLESKLVGLRNVAYYIELDEFREETDTQLLLLSATSNLTTKSHPKSTRYQKLTLKPQRLRNALKKLFKRDIGAFHATLEERFSRDINSESTIASSNAKKNDAVKTEDSRTNKKWTLKADYSPLNRFKITGEISTQNETYVRNINTSDTGSTFKNNLNLKTKTSFKLFKKIKLDANYTRLRTLQYKSNSIDTSASQIIGNLNKNSNPTGNNSLYSRDQKIGVNMRFPIFKKLDLTAGASFRDLDEIFTTNNAKSKAIDQEVISVGSIFRPFKGFTFTANSEFKNTKENNAAKGSGQTINLKTRYQLKKSKNFSVNINYDVRLIQGQDINTLSKELSKEGSGDAIQSTVSKQDNATHTGSISVNMVFPLVDSPYIDNFTFTAEGHIKRIEDNIDSGNSYDITGIILKGVLNF